MTEVKLGICTNFAIKRWANPEDWVRLVKEDFGLDLIQFSFDQYDPRSEVEGLRSYCDKVRNCCERYGVRIHSTFAGLSIYSHNLLYHPLQEGRKDALDWFEKAFAMTNYLGVNTTGGPIGGLDIRSFKDSELRSRLEESALESLDYLLAVAKQRYGIQTFLWEQTPVRREGVVTVQESIDFLNSINQRSAGEERTRFELCLDLGHFTSEETPQSERDPYYWIERTADAANIIHLQQTDGRLDRHWPFTKEKNAGGVIHLDKVMDSLRKSGRRKVQLFLEIGHPFEERDDKVYSELEDSVEYWRRVLER